MYNKLKFLHRKTQSVFFFKFTMIHLLSRHHPGANPSPPFPLCPAAGQRGRGGEGLAEAQLPHIFQDGVSPFAPAPESAPALPRFAVTGPEAIDPACPGRAVHFNCDAIYGVHLAIGSSLHSRSRPSGTSDWRSCAEGADWSPACSRDWGISGGCIILVTKCLNRWVWCLFSNCRKSIGYNETAITPR